MAPSFTSHLPPQRPTFPRSTTPTMSNGYDQYNYSAFPQPQLQPQPQPYLPQKQEQHPTPLVVSQERASRSSVVKKTCLITTAILVVLAGLIFAFVSFLCVFHQCQVSTKSIISTAPLGRVLTISQVTSHVAPLSVPIIMGLFSYLLSAEWLRSSVTGSRDRPSPKQLGLLMSLCDGAGLSALFSSVKYVASKPEKGQQKVDAPPMLRKAITFLGSMLAVTYITTAADSWLHASSSSVTIPSTKPFAHSGVATNFGRDINQTTCEIASTPADQFSVVVISSATCGLLHDGAHGLTAELAEGIRVIDNSSTINQMVLTDDQTAIMIPLSIPPSVSYKAKTLGVRSRCATVTKQCLDPTTNPDGSLNYGFDAGIFLNCVHGGINYVNSTALLPLCPLSSSGLCVNWQNITNPFVTGEVMASMAYIDPNTNYSNFLGNTGWFFHGESGAWNVVMCNVSMLDVTYTYESSRYITESASLLPINVTQAISSALFMVEDGTRIVSAAVDGAGYNNDPPYEQVYSWELSRQVLGRAAYIYALTPVLDINEEVDVSGSKLQFAPFVLFLVALVVFGLQVLYISLRIIIGTMGTRYVELAAQHLSDPLTTVQRLYGHPDPVFSWETKAEKKFVFETEEDRLRVGPVSVSDDPNLGAIFAVTRG